jgi:subtilase family serine protease
MATASSGGTPLPPSEIERLFLPTHESVAAVGRYMRSRGFELASANGLALTFRGNASSARRAFAVGLSVYRGQDGRTFRAPDGAVTLPASLAPYISAVNGLDTALRMHTHTSLPSLPHAVTPSCNGPIAARTRFGGYLPAQFAQAYGHDQLLANGYDGDGEAIALLEFSRYNQGDVATFRNCFNITSPVVSTVAINGGAPNLRGAIEVELDIEVALSNAPGLDQLYVYSAPNNIAQFLAIVNRMVTDSGTTRPDLHIASDSWGICEGILPASTASAESQALELAAVAGISFYAASGDDGSSGCATATQGGYLGPVTDDPAVQPFATGVGGTTLGNPASPPGGAWKRSGGGISWLWPLPSYQSGAKFIDSRSAPCGALAGVFCRQVPDVALDANPHTGYIIYCSALGCPTNVHWFPVGGTSAAAPLMAAITADANESSRATGGGRLGYANPCLYSAAPGTFSDVTSGTNNLYGIGVYRARVGYDMATGLGSPKAQAFAQMVRGCSGSPPTQATISLTVAGPITGKVITYGQLVKFRGTLLSDGEPLPNREVYVELREGAGPLIYRVRSDATGHWSLGMAKALRRNLRWQAVFPGSDGEPPSVSSTFTLLVAPHLTNGSTRTSIALSEKLTMRGSTAPFMKEHSLLIQYRGADGVWHHFPDHAHIGEDGKYGGYESFPHRGLFAFRFHYDGSSAGPWMSSNSPIRWVRVV